MENAITNAPSVTLTERLNHYPEMYRYLLLDPLKTVASVNPLHPQQLKQSPGENAIYPVLRRDLAYSPEHCPLLVLLASPGEACTCPWLDGTEGYARGEALQDKRYLCGWLVSSQKPEQLAVSLAEQCDRISQTFLPFFEPLRFELLQAMSPVNGLAGSIWPVSQWWYMTVAGELACQTGQASDEKWRLNWGAEWIQQNVRAVGQILQAWGAVSTVLPSDAAMQAAIMWKKTAETGLKDPRDRYFLATCSLGTGVDIAQHPAVNDLIQQVIAEPSVPLSRRLQALPETIKQALMNEACHPTERNKGV
ncbi:hypothetical protein [Intestinirhabdus alba]|jgi:hypothetical protein|uniref:DUF4123 domain-containing protein n=1 Tax=Intestinirhabdus alba TaxID=2899544 RepID=A0A6L6IK16_9ENTR|nr:hypothetical protein [Intestinirhabdus alba]MTH46485.1 hypothetical protein [Intestinirhabdus alba]